MLTISVLSVLLEQQLVPHGFLRVHKGYLVNFRYVSQIEQTEVLLTTISAAASTVIAILNERAVPGQRHYGAMSSRRSAASS